MKKDISDVGNDDFVMWFNFIGERVYDVIKGTDSERFVDTSNTYTVSSNPQTTALPADFGDIASTGMGFFEINASDSSDTDRRLTRTGPGSGQVGYYITGNTNVVFTGMDGSEQFRLRYLPTRTKFTDITDYFTIDGLTGGAVLVPDNKEEYLIQALDVLYNQWDEMTGAEISSDHRFLRAMDNLILNVRREPDAYALADYSQSF